MHIGAVMHWFDSSPESVSQFSSAVTAKFPYMGPYRSQPCSAAVNRHGKSWQLQAVHLGGHKLPSCQKKGRVSMGAHFAGWPVAGPIRPVPGVPGWGVEVCVWGGRHGFYP